MADDREQHSLFVPPLIQDHIQGVLSASVVLIMYGDYECFQCANVYRLIKAAQQQLNPSFEENDVCFIFRHFPQFRLNQPMLNKGELNARHDPCGICGATRTAQAGAKRGDHSLRIHG